MQKVQAGLNACINAVISRHPPTSHTKFLNIMGGLVVCQFVRANWHFITCIWVHSMFFLHLYKGDNFCDFLFATLENMTLPQWSPLLIKEQISPKRAYSFFLTVDPH